MPTARVASLAKDHAKNYSALFKGFVNYTQHYKAFFWRSNFLLPEKLLSSITYILADAHWQKCLCDNSIMLKTT